VGVPEAGEGVFMEFLTIDGSASGLLGAASGEDRPGGGGSEYPLRPAAAHPGGQRPNPSYRTKSSISPWSGSEAFHAAA